MRDAWRNGGRLIINLSQLKYIGERLYSRLLRFNFVLKYVGFMCITQKGLVRETVLCDNIVTIRAQFFI